MSKCYFCNSNQLRQSRTQRSVLFQGGIYQFKKCDKCRGFSLFPKLTESQLSSLYSSDYLGEIQFESLDMEPSEKSKFSFLENYLKNLEETTGKNFLDYGCGANPISFKYASEVGLSPLGMELTQEVREIAQAQTHGVIMSKDEIISGNNRFDFIFLGDVLEHLIDPINELETLNKVLAKNGLLIAQGPLQGSRTITHLLVRFFAWLTYRRSTSYPPYHVSLATTRSMKKLLDKSGFKLEQMIVFEVDWPAPTFKEVKKSFSVRSLMLFLAKQIDKHFANVLKSFGSRYFLVCSKPEKRVIAE